MVSNNELDDITIASRISDKFFELEENLKTKEIDQEFQPSNLSMLYAQVKSFRQIIGQDTYDAKSVEEAAARLKSLYQENSAIIAKSPSLSRFLPFFEMIVAVDFRDNIIQAAILDSEKLASTGVSLKDDKSFPSSASASFFYPAPSLKKDKQSPANASARASDSAQSVINHHANISSSVGASDSTPSVINHHATHSVPPAPRLLSKRSRNLDEVVASAFQPQKRQMTHFPLYFQPQINQAQYPPTFMYVQRQVPRYFLVPKTTYYQPCSQVRLLNAVNFPNFCHGPITRSC